VVDTASKVGIPPGNGPMVSAGDELRLVGRSMTVLRRPA
jgi:glycogen operon protein